MSESPSQVLTDHQSQSIRYLYDKHAGMLLGYVFEVVKDRKLAEEYLVKIFSALSMELKKSHEIDIITWCQLLKFTKAKLRLLQGFNKYEEGNTLTGVEIARPDNQYLNRLNEMQKQVFCGIYHHGKTISALSIALNTTEDLTRKTLKEAFLIMRSNG